MTVEVKNADSNAQVEQKVSDKEMNFRAQEAKYERLLANERTERERLAKEIDEIKKAKTSRQEDDEDSEPYVDHKKLDRRLKNLEKDIEEKIDKRAEERAYKLLEKKSEQDWIDNNPDFYETVQAHAQRFFEKAPRLAESILKMPDNFERKKLVYHNIKSLGIDKPEVKPSTIQDKVDANKRSPFYQPSGMGAAPYAPVGDFSDAGKKRAWEEVQKLKANLRLGA